MKRLTCILIALSLAILAEAQIVSPKWLLSNNNVISFDDEISVVENPQNITPQLAGTAVVSDVEGNIIFTATGYAIFDSEWEVINNGDNIQGSPDGSSWQSPTVLQRPGFPSQYYVFYNRRDSGFGYLRYSIVDICDENNEISIDPAEKNIHMPGILSNRLTIVEIDKDNYWLLTTEQNKAKLLAFKIDVNGINMVPVVTSIDDALYSDWLTGILKINNANNKLAWSGHFGWNVIEDRLLIYDFDINTGTISNKKVVQDGLEFPWQYGMEWSPSDQYLYYTFRKYESQDVLVLSYDVEEEIIDTLHTSVTSKIGQLKLSPNKDKIIGSSWSNNKLIQISELENGGSYSEIDLNFEGDIELSLGLQEQVINYGFEIPEVIIDSWDLIINEGEEFIEISLPNEYTNVVWSDGQTGNTATFSEIGIYNVKANYDCHLVFEEFIVERQEVLVPDFNTTFVDISVHGDVSTNDITPASTTYGPTPILKSFPDGANYILTLNSDGTYTFLSDMTGVYTWNLPVCISPNSSGCNNTDLVINVVDFLEPDLRPIANLDIITTAIETDIEIYTLDNDRCSVLGGCSLDPSSVSIVSDPSNGAIAVDAITGNSTYSPDQGFIGHDTLRYQVCVEGEPSNCAEANQIIIISPTVGLNATLAADDFNTGAQDTPLTGNVSTNDSDPNNDNQTVIPQSLSNEAGIFTLSEDGSYTFLPNETFYGPVDFAYETCDDNISQACASATLHLLIIRDLYFQVRVYLEGAFINNDNAKGSTHDRPLMRDDLRESPFTGERYIPDFEPYDLLAVSMHWETAENSFLYEPLMRFDYDYSAMESKFKTVFDTAAVFADNGEDAAVDWISIELRDKNDYNNIIASRSGIVQRDGDVMDLNGELGLRFKNLTLDDYYIVVRHRNHLGAMTAVAKTPHEYADIIDFTIDDTGFFDFGTTKNINDYTGLSQSDLTGSPESNKNGYKALWGGDFDGDGRIKFVNPNDDLNTLLGNIFGYETDGAYNYSTNFDFVFGYLNGDYDMNSQSKFDSPNDDKNYLYGKLIFYPLNSDFNSNFDFFIEQVPEAFTIK